MSAAAKRTVLGRPLLHSLCWAAVNVAVSACGSVGPTVGARPGPEAKNLMDPKMPHPAPNVRKRDASTLNASCEACHREISDEWRESLHRKAYTEPAFQRALAIEPTPFCRGCHAPEADPRKEPSPEQAALGVGCVTCHVTGRDTDAVLAATHGDTPSASTPHPVVRSTAFASPAACATCHEFSFPRRSSSRLPTELMQSTVTEHARSPFSSSSCASCHMPKIETSSGVHTDHTFYVSRNDALLKASVQAVMSRTATGVSMRLRSKGVGHAFPTGDLFRRLTISLEVHGADGQVLWSRELYLAREFESVQDVHGNVYRATRRDDRLSNEQEIRIPVDEHFRSEPLWWRLTYDRVDHPNTPSGKGAAVSASVILTEGTLLQ